MLTYKVMRTNLPVSTITTPKFIEGKDLRDMLGGNYCNVTHIERFNKMVKPCEQIIVRESDPENEDEAPNDLFPGVRGTVVVLKGTCDVN